MGKIQGNDIQTMKVTHRGGTTAATAWAPLRVEITQYGGQTPCVIVKQGTDPEPTCVNPHCPRLENCQRHEQNRKDNGLTPSIAIITWYECSWYQPIKKNNNGTSKRPL